MTIKADSAGVVAGKFTVPAGIPAGTKRVVFIGVGGSYGEMAFAGQGALRREEMRQETTITETRWQSPPPPESTPPAPVDTSTSNPPEVKEVPPVPDVSEAPSAVQIAVEKIQEASIVAAANGEKSLAANLVNRAGRIVNETNESVRGTLVESATAVAAATLEKLPSATVQVTDAIQLVSDAALVAAKSGNKALADNLTARIEKIFNTANASAQATLIKQATAMANTVINTLNDGSRCVTDPLGQTFVLGQSAQVSGVDLWFTARGTSTVRVDIRTVAAGVPTQEVLASASRPAAELSTSAATRFEFSELPFLSASVEYALVVMCNDETTAAAIAELGKWDAAASRWVTSQPYTVGVLLSSSNASTWTPHQDRDLAFRLLRADYTETARTLDLGTVTVSGATDLMLMAYAGRQSAAAAVDYTLTLPDGGSVPVSDGQTVRLPAPVSGAVAVAARLGGTAEVSPMLHPGIQLVAGQVAEAADYVTRAIPAGDAARVRVVFDALIPAGAGVAVAVQGIDGGDAWQAVHYEASLPLGEGWMEMAYELGTISEAMVRVKLTLSGHSAARPRVKNLRAIVL